MITTPIRFFHKETGLRVEAVETPYWICGDKEDPCKCVFFNKKCLSVCLDVGDVLGCSVYFKEVVKDESR